jgi:hypothetical protein
MHRKWILLSFVSFCNGITSVSAPAVGVDAQKTQAPKIRAVIRAKMAIRNLILCDSS